MVDFCEGLFFVEGVDLQIKSQVVFLENDFVIVNDFVGDGMMVVYLDSDVFVVGEFLMIVNWCGYFEMSVGVGMNDLMMMVLREDCLSFGIWIFFEEIYVVDSIGFDI